MDSMRHSTHAVRAVTMVAASLWVGLAFAQAGSSNPAEPSVDDGLHGAPHFVRYANLSKEHLAGHWPFTADEGELTCVTTDGLAFAFFKSEEAEEPFMISPNMLMSLIGKMITGASGYIRRGYDPAKLIEDLERAYAVAMVRCGPPYAQ
ncbi:MAG: hypothetical protein AB3N20_10380 [Rhizobiaceae bacterium]